MSALIPICWRGPWLGAASPVALLVTFGEGEWRPYEAAPTGAERHGGRCGNGNDPAGVCGRALQLPPAPRARPLLP